ncbi:MAG: tRNA (adenosine(37)-N6)-threonylcarbamoyltransferase complex dimerization subunit type 1 TsaB [Arsenophonus sp.]|nr:MAG: tRNA (adenosine(37)-N6)-threonylcarbamoyltransferase complex dimerization subunit type 1 TsaB [Arsenophonus sp.]
MNLNILAFDTSIDHTSVAILHQNKIFKNILFSPQEHIKKIFPMIKKCLLDAKITLQDIHIIAFSSGPGNFSSVRISVAIAQGFAFSYSSFSLINISSLLTLAQSVYQKIGIKNVIVAIDAKMGEIYTACYKLNSNNYWSGSNTEIKLKPENFIEKIKYLRGTWAIAGDAWSKYSILKNNSSRFLVSNIIFINACDMIPIAIQFWKKKKITFLKDIFLNYL